MLLCEIHAYSSGTLSRADRVLVRLLLRSATNWDGSLVVDVGGGFGDVTMVIDDALPDLQYNVQGRSATMQ